MKLAGRLYDLDVMPYPKEAVEEYKKEKVYELEAESRVPFFARHPVLVGLAVGCASVALFFANLEGASLSFAGGFFGIFCGIFGLLIVARTSDACTDEENSWGWERAPFSEYRERVPEKVRKEVSRIRNIVPFVNFEVEYLVRMKDRKVFDPLLILKYESYECCIEIWDEQDLEAEHPA
jgi:hypothetical protein